MKRFIKYFLISVATVLLLAAVGIWLAKKGISPLVDHEVIGNGRVIVAVDSTSPMPVAAYLLRLSNGKFALVDTGMDPQAKSIRETIRQYGSSESEIAAIFCTHSHGDHTGGVSSFPNATIYIMAVSPDLETSPSSSTWNKFQNAVPSGQEKHSFLDSGKVCRLHDGEIVKIGEDSIQAFSIPGHTPDSCAFLAFEVLFLGDAAAGQHNGKIGGPPPFVSVDRGIGKDSLKKLANRLDSPNFKIETLAFGHQGPVKGFAPLRNWANPH